MQPRSELIQIEHAEMQSNLAAWKCIVPEVTSNAVVLPADLATAVLKSMMTNKVLGPLHVAALRTSVIRLGISDVNTWVQQD